MRSHFLNTYEKSFLTAATPATPHTKHTHRTWVSSLSPVSCPLHPRISHILFQIQSLPTCKLHQRSTSKMTAEDRGDLAPGRWDRTEGGYRLWLAELWSQTVWVQTLPFPTFYLYHLEQSAEFSGPVVKQGDSSISLVLWVCGDN